VIFSVLDHSVGADCAAANCTYAQNKPTMTPQQRPMAFMMPLPSIIHFNSLSVMLDLGHWPSSSGGISA
jgi:hypothetical protein